MLSNCRKTGNIWQCPGGLIHVFTHPKSTTNVPCIITSVLIHYYTGSFIHTAVYYGVECFNEFNKHQSFNEFNKHQSIYKANDLLPMFDTRGGHNLELTACQPIPQLSSSLPIPLCQTSYHSSTKHYTRASTPTQ